MNTLDQLSELRGIYARSINALACCDNKDSYRMRLLQKCNMGLHDAIDAMERLVKSETRSGFFMDKDELERLAPLARGLKS